MTPLFGALPSLPFAAAGGAVIFGVFVVVLFFVLVYGYYTRRGSGISQTPYRRPDAPPESPSELSHDMVQDISNWQRGTAGHYRQRPDAGREPVDPAVAAALLRSAEWVERSRSPGSARWARRSCPRPGEGRTVTVYLDLASKPCRFAWQLLQRVGARQPLRVAVRHLPLADVHPLALPAAEVLEAAAAQGEFFELLGRLAGGRVDTASELIEIAAGVVGDPERLRSEVADGRHRPKIIEHIHQATASRAHAIPELYIDADRYDGVLARDVLSRALA